MLLFSEKSESKERKIICGLALLPALASESIFLSTTTTSLPFIGFLSCMKSGVVGPSAPAIPHFLRESASLECAMVFICNNVLLELFFLQDPYACFNYYNLFTSPKLLVMFNL